MQVEARSEQATERGRRRHGIHRQDLEDVLKLEVEAEEPEAVPATSAQDVEECWG